jgi:hypothetical protein
MAGTLAVPLSKILQIFQRQVIAKQMQQAVQQHGGVTGRKNKAIAIRPMRIARVLTKKVIPNGIRDRSKSHWRSGMAGMCLLHRIHR